MRPLGSDATEENVEAAVDISRSASDFMNTMDAHVKQRKRNRNLDPDKQKVGHLVLHLSEKKSLVFTPHRTSDNFPGAREDLLSYLDMDKLEEKVKRILKSLAETAEVKKQHDRHMRAKCDMLKKQHSIGGCGH